MEKQVRKRPSSDELIDLHISIVPPEHWIERLNYASPKVIDETFSAGFIRVHPDRTISSLRTAISEQIGDHIFPEKYVFLKHIGRCLALVNDKQENHLKAKNFVPPRNTLPELFILPSQPSSYNHQTLPQTKLAPLENKTRQSSVKETRLLKNYEYNTTGQESTSSHSQFSEPRVSNNDPHQRELRMRQRPVLQSRNDGKHFYNDAGSETLGERFVSGQSVADKHILPPNLSRTNTPNAYSSANPNLNAKYVGTHEKESNYVSASKRQSYEQGRGDDDIGELAKRRYRMSDDEDATPLPDSGIVVERHTPDNKSQNMIHQKEQPIQDSNYNSEENQYYHHPQQNSNPYHQHNQLSTDPHGQPITDQYYQSTQNSNEHPSQYKADNLHPHQYPNHDENGNKSPSVFTEPVSGDHTGKDQNGSYKTNKNEPTRSDPISTNPSQNYHNHSQASSNPDEDDQSNPGYESEIRKVQYVNHDSGFNDRSHDSEDEGAFVEDRSETLQQQYSHHTSNDRDRRSFVKGVADDRYDDSKMSYRQTLQAKPLHVSSSRDRLSPGWHSDAASGSGSQYSVRDSDDGSLLDDYQPVRTTSQTRFYDEGRIAANSQHEQNGGHQNQHVENTGEKQFEEQHLYGVESETKENGVRNMDHNKMATKAGFVAAGASVSPGDLSDSSHGNRPNVLHESAQRNHEYDQHFTPNDNNPESNDLQKQPSVNTHGGDMNGPDTNNSANGQHDPLGHAFPVVSPEQARQQQLHNGNREEDSSFYRTSESNPHTENHVLRPGTKNFQDEGASEQNTEKRNPLMKMFPPVSTSHEFQEEKLKSSTDGRADNNKITEKAVTGNATDNENLLNRGNPDGMPMHFAMHADTEPMQVSNEEGRRNGESIYNAEKPVIVGTPHSHHQNLELLQEDKPTKSISESDRPGQESFPMKTFNQRRPFDKKENEFTDFAKTQNEDSTHESRTSSAEKRNLAIQKQRLWNELQRMKENRAYFEKQRQELVKRAKNTSAQINHRRGAGRDLWKRRYYNEKKKTATLTDLCERLHQQHDTFRKKWPSHQAATLTLSRDKSTVLPRADVRPSVKSNSKIQASRTLQSIEDLKKKLNNAKIRLTGEVKLRHEAEQELKNMKQGLLNKKIQSHVAFRKMNKYRSNVYYSPSARNKNAGFQSQLR
ncbi:uncharacterized protein LOC120339705 [Styela clava]